jgi:hypothetical protein
VCVCVCVASRCDKTSPDRLSAHCDSAHKAQQAQQKSRSQTHKTNAHQATKRKQQQAQLQHQQTTARVAHGLHQARLVAWPVPWSCSDCCAKLLHSNEYAPVRRVEKKAITSDSLKRTRRSRPAWSGSGCSHRQGSRAEDPPCAQTAGTAARGEWKGTKQASRDPKGTNRDPKGTNRDPKGTNRDPKGTNRDPKGTNRDTSHTSPAYRRQVARRQLHAHENVMGLLERRLGHAAADRVQHLLRALGLVHLHGTSVNRVWAKSRKTTTRARTQPTLTIRVYPFP